MGPLLQEWGVYYHTGYIRDKRLRRLQGYGLHLCMLQVLHLPTFTGFVWEMFVWLLPVLLTDVVS